MKFKADIFDPQLRFSIEEASGEVDGKHILAKMKGGFFVPDGTSRNDRFYSKGLWEKQLNRPEIQKKLQERRMIGTIGHTQPINDDAVRQRKISHITTKLEIKGNQGYGEALILDTPTGRVLNTLTRAGVKMFVSSRADGDYSGEHEGVPKVDEDKYDLQAFDFVLDPGFLEANPQLVESLQDDLKTLGTGGETVVQPRDRARSDSSRSSEEKNMGDQTKEVLESVVKENGSIKADLKAALDENEKGKSERHMLREENTHMKKQLESARKDAAELGKYRELGTPGEVNKALDLAEAKLREYRKLGTPAEINQALDESLAVVRKYKDLGTPGEVDEALTRAKKLIVEYRKLGTPKEIAEAFSRTEKMIESTKKERQGKKITELAQSLGARKEQVSKLVEKGMSDEEIKVFFKDVTESNRLGNKFRAGKTLNEGRRTDGKPEPKLVNEKEFGARLMESMSR